MSPLKSLRVVVLALATSLCLAVGAAQLVPARAAVRPVHAGVTHVLRAPDGRGGYPSAP